MGVIIVPALNCYGQAANKALSINMLKIFVTINSF